MSIPKEDTEWRQRPWSVSTVSSNSGSASRWRFSFFVGLSGLAGGAWRSGGPGGSSPNFSRAGGRGWAPEGWAPSSLELGGSEAASSPWTDALHGFLPLASSESLEPDSSVEEEDDDQIGRAHV